MKNIYSSLFAAAVAVSSPNAQALAHQSVPTQAVSQTKGPNYQEMCEEQALIISRELLPQIRTRAERAISGGLDSVEVKFRPDPNWPMQYIQSQVAYYLDGEIDDAELGKFSLDFPNPFTDFSLRYWKNGTYRLIANCKYPEKK